MCPFNALGYSCLSLSQSPPSSSQSWKSHLSTLGATGFSSCILQHQGSQALTHHSPFLLWERLLPPDNLASCSVARGRDSAGKVLSSPLLPNSFSFIAPVVCRSLRLGRLIFCNFSLVSGYLPRSAVSRYFPDHGKRGWDGFTAPLVT